MIRVRLFKHRLVPPLEAPDTDPRWLAYRWRLDTYAERIRDVCMNPHRFNASTDEIDDLFENPHLPAAIMRAARERIGDDSEPEELRRVAVEQLHYDLDDSEWRFIVARTRRS